MYQPELFDQVFTPSRLADIGMDMAKDHADSLIDEWSETAYAFLLLYIKDKEEFMAEDIRLASVGVVPEHTKMDNRAWGAIIRRANREKVIEATGRFAPQKSVSCHGSFKPIWRKVCLC